MFGKVYKVRLTRLAALDLQDGIAYYDSESKGLGKRFRLTISARLKRLRSFWSYEVKYEDVRIFRIPPFPYSAHYRVDDVKEEIIILTILHDKRDSPLGKD